MYKPLDEIVPPLADQPTMLLLVPLTVAENGWLLPSATDAAVGETTTLTAAVGLEDADTVNDNEFDRFPFRVLSMTTEYVPAVAMSVL